MPQVNFTQGIMKYNDIKPIFAGMSQCKSLHSYGPAIRHHCLIHYCVRGKGIFQNKDGTYEIEAGQIFIINPEEITFYRADEENPWMYTWIAFSGVICEKIKKLPSVITIKNTSVFENIQKLIAEGVFLPEEYLINLIRLFGEILPSSPDNKAGYATRAKDYIKLHYMEDISVEGISASLGVDRRYLLRLFKKEYGITIVNYIVNTRLSAAYGFLASGIPVSKAAVMCGYTDVYNFSKMFKKYHGVSPSDVKRKSVSENKADLSKDDEYIYCQ